MMWPSSWTVCADTSLDPLQESHTLAPVSTAPGCRPKRVRKRLTLALRTAAFSTPRRIRARKGNAHVRTFVFQTCARPVCSQTSSRKNQFGGGPGGRLSMARVAFLTQRADAVFISCDCSMGYKSYAGSLSFFEKTHVGFSTPISIVDIGSPQPTHSRLSGAAPRRGAMLSGVGARSSSWRL